MPDAMAAADLKKWSEMPENFEAIKAAFQTTTRFGEDGLRTLLLWSVFLSMLLLLLPLLVVCWMFNLCCFYC